MDKMKSNMLWVIIGLALVAELVIYVFVVNGKASENEARINEISGVERKIERLAKDAVRTEIIEKAEEHKLALQQEYARMVLHLIDLDENLDNFASIEVPPADALRVADTSIKPKLITEINRQIASLKANDDTVVPPEAASPWDFINLSGTPDTTKIRYALKQLTVQKALFNVMSKPAAPGKDSPLVAVINKISFQPPTFDQKNSQQAMPIEERYVYYRFNIDVLMPATSVPILLERILTLDIPVSLESSTVTKATSNSNTGGISRAKQKIVNVKATYKLLDLTMGVSKVTFSKDEFENPEAVSKWLTNNSDETAKVLLQQIQKPGVSPRDIDGMIEYEIYGKSSLLVDPYQCEIFDGVTVYYGELPRQIPNTNELRNL